jgi:hypothetical protein
MKTLINQYNDICRLSDDDAAEVIRMNYGWEYCEKAEWKKRQREQNQREGQTIPPSEPGRQDL